MRKRGSGFEVFLKERQVLWKILPGALYSLFSGGDPYPLHSSPHYLLSIKRPHVSLSVTINSTSSDCADLTVA